MGRLIRVSLCFFVGLHYIGCADHVSRQGGAESPDSSLAPGYDLGMSLGDIGSPNTPDLGLIEPKNCANDWEVTNTVMSLSCDTNSMQFTPEVHLNGTWQPPTQCRQSDSRDVTCNFPLGVLTLRAESGVLRPSFQASTELTFDGFRLRGEGRVGGIESWLSNGFQSWSQSGLIQIGAPYSAPAIQTALSMQGDVEVVRSGKELSWWLSYVVAPIHLIAGAVSADRFKTWIQFSQVDETVLCTVTSGQTNDQIALASNDTVEGEGLWIQFKRDLNKGLEQYAAQLPRRAMSFATAEAGWNSWYELWDDVTAIDVLENARLVPAILDPLTTPAQRPYRIVIDDGWQVGWGQWRANDGFPGGMSVVAQQLIAEGFMPGIWLAPLLVSASAPVVTEHPDWFLPEASFTHLGQGEMRILDVTHPDAAQSLTDAIERLVDAGFTLLKIDFLFAGTYASARFEPMPAMQAYRRALLLIRQAAGDSVTILAVGAPPIAGFEFIDNWRLGPDIALELFDASWFFIPGTARASAARWPFCVHTLCDGDPALLRNLTQSEVVTGGWAAAFAGGAFFLSDDLRTLERERTSWLAQDMVAQGLSGQPARPEQMFMPTVPAQLNSQILDESLQRSNHHVPTAWQISNQRTLWVNLTDEPLMTDGQTVPPRSVITP